MRDGPPAELINLLARLRLATPDEVRAVRNRARRLARNLPLFESVWVDALAQARTLTPYQAAEINAGRGAGLSTGPYVVRRFSAAASYAQIFEASDLDTRQAVQLIIASLDADRAKIAAEILQAIAQCMQSVDSKAVLKLEAAGEADGTVWAAYQPASGLAVQQWLSQHGRLAPGVALEIARQMASGLAALEAAGLVHGDISVGSLYLDDSGSIQLARTGVRCAIRPDESALADRLAPESLDYLAPERLADAESLPTTAGDAYACGLLWWHLLTGRPPRPGGNVREKLSAIQGRRLPDVRRIAPDVSAALASVIERCTHLDPAMRPQSFAELTELLGQSTEAGRRRLSTALIASGRRTLPWPVRARVQGGLEKVGSHLLAAAACALLIAAASWPLWRSHDVRQRGPSAKAVADSPVDKSSPTEQQHLVSSPSKNRSNEARDEAAHPVRHANYQIDEQPPSPKPVSQAAKSIIELPTGKEITAGTLRLSPGAIVRGVGDRRPTIAVPPCGLVLIADDVRFENIDFVWRQRAEAVTMPDRHAIIDMRCTRATFVGCTFQAVAVPGFDLPPAIVHRGRAEYMATLPAAGQVELDRCSLAGVACAIDCRLAGPAAIEIRNTLHAGAGPLVRFVEARRPDAPTVITLDHVTVRDASSVVELHVEESPEGTAPVTLSTTACIFAPCDDGSLLALSGDRPPRTLFKALEWLGQGCLATPDTAVARWNADRTVTLPVDELSIDGLVFSKVEFEGNSPDDPTASRVKRWLAPGLSDEPPGIGADLPKLTGLQALSQIAERAAVPAESSSAEPGSLTPTTRPRFD